MINEIVPVNISLDTFGTNFFYTQSSLIVNPQSILPSIPRSPLHSQSKIKVLRVIQFCSLNYFHTLLSKNIIKL